MIYFEPKNHLYTSIKPEHSNLKWTSITSLFAGYHEKFDMNAVSKKCSNAKKGKWVGYSQKEIKQIWDDERIRAISVGNWYHDQREQDVLECQTIVQKGVELPVIKPIYDSENRKTASSQKLINGLYPELLIYMRSAQICGQADLIEVIDGKVYVIDYKTNKEIKYKSFVNWEGMSKKMLGPLSHLDDCNFNHYALQLSAYMYMILRANPKLKPGGLTLHHVSFEKAGENEHGYPILKKDNDGNYVIDKVKEIHLPYMKQEVMDVIKNHKQKNNIR